MTTRARSTTGCWTCRIRRKKCDEGKPVCQRCSKLQLDCDGYGERPPWMDGGEQEKLRAEQMQQARKNKGSTGLSKTQQTLDPASLHTAFASDAFDFSSSDASSSLTEATRDPMDKLFNQNDYFGDLDFATLEPSTTGEMLPPLPTPASSIEHFDLSPFTALEMNSCSYSYPIINPPILPQHHLSIPPRATSIGEEEGTLILHYFQYVHGIQAPFSSRLDRGWLYSIVVRTQASYWSTLTLTSYIQGLDAFSYHSRALAELQIIDTTKFDSELYQDRCLDYCFAMAQLVFFESLKGAQETYLIHSRAVSSLLNSLANVTLSSLNLKVCNFVNTALWWIHIISGCSLRSNYTLHNPENCHFLHGQQVLTENIPDFPSWIITCLWRISQLDHWKKSAVQNRSLSMFELVKRASDIHNQLRGRTSTSSASPSNSVSGMWTPGSGKHDSQVSQVTGIFASAAVIYLNVVVSGSQGNISEISDGVRESVSQFRQLPSRDLLRVLLWPFVVTSCFASGEDRQYLSSMATNAISETFCVTGIEKAFSVVQECWRLRDLGQQIDADWVSASTVLNKCYALL
ncbi:hypothetical protein OCU04_001087 [Sclerotinia nivalis]|uniref:Zn(2)-C6 fungal-type domain-containing protein n=1 Tax=Sclerotinia nivalis TaxID=352851 RepID=A0A9X0AXE9_9HELO|nr:hypothetical protein OCU04_001087 [Sclerotinia nivalis]